MRKQHYDGYRTCVHSLKRKSAPWRVTSGCENLACLRIGRRCELPNQTVCVTCPFYSRDERILGREK